MSLLIKAALSFGATLVSVAPAFAQAPSVAPSVAPSASGPSANPSAGLAEPLPLPVAGPTVTSAPAVAPGPVAAPVPAPVPQVTPAAAPPPSATIMSAPPAAAAPPAPSVVDVIASKGSFYGKVYLDWHYDATDDDTITKKSEFDITRVYLGYKYAIDEHFSANVLLDVERTNPVKTVAVDATTGAVTTTTDSRYVAYLKAASLDWKDILPHTTLTVGQMGYIAFNVQEAFWGKRYIYKSFMDQQGWEPSADLGATVKVAPNDMFTIVAGAVNGDGYKAPQDIYGDYKLALGVQVKPVAGLIIYAYGDWMPVGSPNAKSQTTLAGFAGYSFQDVFQLGAEYALQLNQKGVMDQNVNGFSFYGDFSILKQLDVFARFDLAASKNDFNTAKDGDTLIGGVQFAPLSKVKFALNYQTFMPKADTLVTSKKVYVNCEFDY